MLPKDKSVTTSSKSSTSKPVGTGPDTPVQFVKGVGPRLGSIFASRDIATVKDLLTFFPRAYEDRTKLRTVGELQEGEKTSLSVRVMGVRHIPMRNRGRSMLEVRCSDASGPLNLKWFYAPRGIEKRFQVGMQIVVTGTVKFFQGKAEIVHPEITWNAGGVPFPNAAAAPILGARPAAPGQLGLEPSEPAENGEPHIGRIVPVYIEIEGVPTRALRKVLWEACEKYLSVLSEDLPTTVLETHKLPRLADAIRDIHFPPEASGGDVDRQIADLMEFNTPAHWRLIYEEFFKFEYLVLRQRLRMEQAYAQAFGPGGGSTAVKDLTKSLPFSLTGDQQKAVAEILEDLSKPHPMNRLIQGDVGSGKTAVSFLAAGAVLAEGGQAALMAPTEILAEQHFKNAQKLFNGRLNCALLTGKTPMSERKPLFERLAKGEPILLIGTHALIEDPVVFKNLAFVMVDEQQRFGVEQRRTFRRKGTRKDPETGKTLHAHGLILTATPIPRTLALTAYGDLSISIIRELPPGRSPIATTVVRGAARAKAYDRIRGEIQKGHQAYFIYPLVNDSEAEGFTSLKSAVAEAENLATEIFPEYKVGLLHGQLKPDEKAQVMDRFKSGELHILVSTTVVEVGVDVPNATVMAIEHAERFGLSQLHQLRGRVGRGSAQSYCFLFTGTSGAENTNLRLDVLEETNDGFKIAEADLEIRGPGEFLGTRQAGGLPFRLAHLVRDREWLIKARDDASHLLKTDPDLLKPEHSPLRRYYEREGNLQFERLKTS